MIIVLLIEGQARQVVTQPMARPRLSQADPDSWPRRTDPRQTQLTQWPGPARPRTIEGPGPAQTQLLRQLIEPSGQLTSPVGSWDPVDSWWLRSYWWPSWPIIGPSCDWWPNPVETDWPSWRLIIVGIVSDDPSWLTHWQQPSGLLLLLVVIGQRDGRLTQRTDPGGRTLLKLLLLANWRNYPTQTQ